jgi:hypothetical protein
LHNETLVTELEGQLRRNVREPVLVRRFLDEIEAISKCVAFELDGWQNDAGPEDPDERRPVQKKRRLNSPAAFDPHYRHCIRRRPRNAGASVDRG